MLGLGPGPLEQVRPRDGRKPSSLPQVALYRLAFGRVARNDDHDATYAQLDLYYVDNWSLLTDMVILARTVPVVLTSRGQH